MHPVLDRLAVAYRPLAGRNRLVEGPHSRPPVEPPPYRRLALLALLAALFGRRP